MHEALVAGGETDVEGAGRGGGVDGQVDEEIVRVAGMLDAGDRHPRVIDGGVGGADAGTVDQKLQLRVLETDPPGWRFHPFDAGCENRRRKARLQAE